MDTTNSGEKRSADEYDVTSDSTIKILVDVNEGTYWDGSAMVESELLKELYAEYLEYAENYPSVFVSMAYENGIAYLSIANTILAYDVEAHTLTRILEYNQAYAVRDRQNAFGGMAFTVTGDAENADLGVENPPIVAINIHDGNMTVSLGTNYAFISGKTAVGDKSSYGYEFQESNFNGDYINFANYGVDMDQWGDLIGQEDNDNDEFMWSANFVDTISMAELTGTSHNYEEVTVEPTCGIDGYTEYRCTDCGRIYDGDDESKARVEDKGSALDHHYIYFQETYYTKENESDTEFLTGDCYVCSECFHSVNYDDDEDADNTEWDALQDGSAASGHVYTMICDEGEADWAEDYSKATFKAGSDLVCMQCNGKLVDFLVDSASTNITNDNELSVPVEEDVETEDIVAGEPIGTCEEGRTTVYTASGEYKEIPFTATTTVTTEAGEHDYDAEFTWTPIRDGEDNITGYEAEAVVSCKNCDEGSGEEPIEAEVTPETTEATCTKAGAIVYTASVEWDGVVLTEDRKSVIPATGHSYNDPKFIWTDYTAKAVFTCKEGDDTQSKDCQVQHEVVEATYVKAGSDSYIATVEFDGVTYTDVAYKKTIAKKVMSTPELLSATSVEGGVKVTWEAVEGATSYQVYRRDASAKSWANSTLGSPVTTTSFTDTTVESGKSYVYTVRGVVEEDGTTVRSGYKSSGISVTYIATPSLKSVANADGGVKVSWSAVSGANRYRVFCKTGSGG